MYIVHVYMRLCLYMEMHVRMSVVYMSASTCMWICMRVCVCGYVCAYEFVCTGVGVHVRACVRVCARRAAIPGVRAKERNSAFVFLRDNQGSL